MESEDELIAEAPVTSINAVMPPIPKPEPRTAVLLNTHAELVAERAAEALVEHAISNGKFRVSTRNKFKRCKKIKFSGKFLKKSLNGVRV
jgi:hypothetical protein